MRPAHLEDFYTFLRFPSVSTDDHYAEKLVDCAHWLVEKLTAVGLEAQLVPTARHPVVWARHKAQKGRRTVLIYGHFDVQPPDPLELWESPPFEPEIRGEYLYGRGVADDKGQLYMLLGAARELAQAGRLPVNVRFACDGEEETGGHSIVEYLAADERAAQAAIIFDSGMIAPGRPAFNVATRGLVYFHLTVRTGGRDLHSGMYGGAALNALHVLNEVLQSVGGENGRLPDSLRQGIAEPTDEERAAWAELVPGEEMLAEAGASPADLKAAEEFYLRTTAEPAHDANGIVGGSPVLQETVLPVEA